MVFVLSFSSVFVFAEIEEGKMEIYLFESESDLIHDKLKLEKDIIHYEKTGIFVSLKAMQHNKWKEVFNDKEKIIPIISKIRYKTKGIWHYIRVQGYKEVILYDDSSRTIVVKEKSGTIDGEKKFTWHLLFGVLTILFMRVANITRLKKKNLYNTFAMYMVFVFMLIVLTIFSMPINNFSFLSIMLAVFVFAFLLLEELSKRRTVLLLILFYMFMVSSLVLFYI